jgi:hypothetical protein
MTQFYYLSAKNPLLTGTFGEKKALSKKGHKKFASPLDEASITIHKIENSMLPNLSYPYQYEITSHLGDLGTYKDQLNELDQKCLQTLLDYIKKSMEKNFVIEYFTAWAGEEQLPPEKIREITIDQLKDPLQLKLHNREKLKIFRKKYEAIM